MRGGAAGRLTGDAPSRDRWDGAPDPFEDIAAPPLRLTPAPVVEPASSSPAHEGLQLPPAPPPAADPDHHPAPAPAAPVAAPEPEPRPSHAKRDLGFAVALGLIVATGLVALALFLRPTLAATEPAPVAGVASTQLGAGPLPQPAAEAPGFTPVSATRVRLRVGPNAGADAATRVRAAMRAAGYAAIEVAPMPFPIDRARIEYFHAADRVAAEAMSRGLAPVTGGRVEVRDLAAAAAEAGEDVGRIDVWLAD